MRPNELRLSALVVVMVGELGFASAATAAPPDQPRTVETVVVTAERRNEKLQSAAVAATVMTADDLKKHEVKGVDDLEFSTPSLAIAHNGQSNQINIRGIGKEDNSGNATSAVAIYRDGIGTISGFATDEPYYDISTVEVLRGPQGTFSGENAAGGAIFINTRDPDPAGGYGGYIEGGYGNYNEFDAQGAINLPIVSDTLALRVAFNHVNRDSFFTVWFDPAMTKRNPQPVGARDYNSVRVGILWQPLDELQIKAKIDYNNLDNHGYAFSVVPGWPIPGSDFFGGGPYAANISSDPFVIGNNSTDNYAVDESLRGALDIRYTLPNGFVFRTLTGDQWLRTYIRNDDDGSAFVDRRQHINATFKIFSEEVTLASPETDRFNWILGGYYKKEILDFPPNDGFVLLDGTHYPFLGPGLIPEIVLLWHTPRTTQAVFGQAQYNITDRLKLQVGLRYQHFIVTERSDLSLFPGTIFELVLPTDIGDPTARGGKGGYNEDTVTGKIALNYQMTDEHYLYAFVATGSTTGGVNVVIGDTNYKNQQTTDIEAGWKASWLDGQLLTQAGGFYDFIGNYQGFATVDGFTEFTNLNGISTLYGLELSAQAVFDNLSLDGSLSLIHSALGSGIIGSPAGPLNTDGKRQPFTPEITFHAGAQYAYQFGDGTSLTPRIDVAYTGGQTTTPVDTVFDGVHLDRVPPHTILNLKLTYGTEKWNGEFFVTNVTDEIYIEAHGGPGYNAYPNEPRRIGFRLHYNF